VCKKNSPIRQTLIIVKSSRDCCRHQKFVGSKACYQSPCGFMQFEVNIGINDVHNALEETVQSVFPKKEGGEGGEDKEKEREEKEGGGEEEYGRMRTMVSQENVHLKAINCNEDYSKRSDNNDQSNHGNYNSNGQKQ
jgi:hypothetical protein